MKTENHGNEQKIRDIYKNTTASDIVKKRTEETLTFLKQQNNSDATVTHRKKKPLTFRRIAAIAAAAILCISGTVFAAERIYQIHLNKKREYQRTLQISTEKKLPKEVEEVKMKVNYIPEGFTYSSEKEYYVNQSHDAGYWISEPVLADEADPLSMSFVSDAQPLTVDGRDAVYIRVRYSADKDWGNGKLYVLYEELNRILMIGSWGHGEKEELIKIAENTDLTPTGKMVASKNLTHWSDIINTLSKEADEKGNDDLAADDYYYDEADETQMANLHQAGDKFDLTSLLGEAPEGSGLEASITKVQVEDDLSLITNRDAIMDETYESWKDLTGPDGKLTSDTLNFIKNGNGTDTMTEVVRTEKQPVKLLYAEAEYTNTGSTTLHNVHYFVNAVPIIKEGAVYKIFDRTDETCDYVENEHIGISTPGISDMPYNDIPGDKNPKNYIKEIKPGESVTVRLAWLVNEDELDKMYLSMNGDSLFTDQGLEIGLVELGTGHF